MQNISTYSQSVVMQISVSDEVMPLLRKIVRNALSYVDGEFEVRGA